MILLVTIFEPRLMGNAKLLFMIMMMMMMLFA